MRHLYTRIQSLLSVDDVYWRVPTDTARVCLAVLLLLITNSMARSEVTGDVELLKLAASEHRENKERIATWQGEALVSATGTEPDGSRWQRKSRAEFVYDRQQQAKRWHWDYLEDVRIVNGVQQQGPLQGFKNALVKDGALYRLDNLFPSDPKVGKPPYRIVIYPLTELQNTLISTNDFDPTYYLTADGFELAKRLEWYYTKLQERSKLLGTISVTQEGTQIVFENGLQGIVQKYVVDLAQGGNLVAFDTLSTDLDRTFTYSYEQHDDVWVPKEVTFEYIHRKQNRHSQRIVTWVRNVVNEPISSKEFELAALGAQLGDRVVDARTNVRYSVSPDMVPEATSKSRVWFRYVLLGNILLLLLIGTIFVVHLWKKRRRGGMSR